ncbi:hypothetical protein [Flavobacterium piscis]|uniref:Biopolymer transport protein ExbB/TolQ n=1 Tax=Flavobacterium piscis TaxID=1114874 RepID=A0ABU1Y1N2_9FLAO|nr:hypothetical protein [Flavobacterium piscis]MDR7208139.1 biopolymer transport protein ExbB/TolQ [Flavobacterium piscis]
MRKHLITAVLILLPILASAQFNNHQMQMQQVRTMHQQMNAQNQKWANERARSNQQWQMRTMMLQQTNKIQTAEYKLAKEEKKQKETRR